MENFFNEERFCSDLGDLMDELDIADPKELRDDWSIKVENTRLEPIIKVDKRDILERLYDWNEERWSDEFDKRYENKVKHALEQSFDIDKFNELCPKAYYPSGEFEEITKQDLIDYCE